MERRRSRVVGAMLEQAPGRYLITQRAKTSSLPLLWEFPGGRVDEGEAPAAAIARELKERLMLDVVVHEQAMATEHAYDSYDIEFLVFRCSLRDPNQPVSHHRANDHRWVTLEELGGYQFPDADAKTVAKLLELEA
ncbi:MAG: (deoxy)nucleoside triphosphate pyrophosphohydrolase [Archangium sp.]|nr:(deoxy)nucleoside triphosphate pyrophosphohydrolase [Archangium sp.]